MTGNQRQRPHRRPPRAWNAVQGAIDCGIDVSALRDNAALTPAERLRRREIALHTVVMLRKARRL